MGRRFYLIWSPVIVEILFRDLALWGAGGGEKFDWRTLA